MLKTWHENRRFTFEAVFIFLYVTIPILDAAFIIPKMKPVCNGQITDQQVKMCTNWIKENAHVSKATSPTGRVYRHPLQDSERIWDREIGTFGSPPSKEQP